MWEVGVGRSFSTAFNILHPIRLGGGKSTKLVLRVHLERQRVVSVKVGETNLQ